MKKVYLIHGWGGNSQSEWFMWIKKELEKRGYEVISPDMPDTSKPSIKNWVGHLNKVVKNPDKDTYFIGHSIGCQTIMRYLQGLSDNVRIGGAIFVAGWFNLTEDTWDEDYTREIAHEWINNPINFSKIKMHTNKFVLINSDDDPYVPLSDAKVFNSKLDAEVIMLKNKGHISDEDGVKEFPILLTKFLQISK